MTSKLPILLLFVISLTSAIPAWADTDYELGVEYLDSGRYLDALKAFGRSAKNGNTDAQYQIGIMFLEGQGLDASPEDAAYWFRKAAQNGHAASQFEIGHCFQSGTGVQADARIAAEWYWRAASQGDPDAAFYLARIYRDGNGMPKDLDKARKYYKKAAAAGIKEAQEELDKLPAPSVKKPTKQSGKRK